MLSNDIRARTLLLYPMLGELPTAELDGLLVDASLMQLPTGTVVFDEKQSCQGFPLLLSGSLRIIKSAASGRELQLYRVVPGESCIMTSSCLLGDSRYQARGVVEEPVEMVFLPAAVFHEMMGKYDAFRRYVFHLFTDRITDLMELVTTVAFQKLDQRLAALLVAKVSPIHATHQAIADELGSAREMVSRLLKAFSEQGWVSLSREQIVVTNLIELKKFATL
jgi:CRP/FNR family transcriptional regulator